MTEPAPRNSNALKKAWGNQVEYSGGIGGGAQRHSHIPELRERRIGHYALDCRSARWRPSAMNNAVIAPITMTKDKAASDNSNRCDMRATMKIPAVTMVAAMDQRGYRRRAFHRVRQPDMQWRKLRRLAHRADEQQDADRGHERPIRKATPTATLASFRRFGKHLRVIEASRNKPGSARCRAESPDRQRG